MSTNKFMLMILDGWGIGDKSHSDAIFNAKTPNLDSLTSKYPHSQLLTCGENVGLPDGQMGNSEVGHLNIGAGRIVYQELVRINKAIREKTLDTNKVLLDAFRIAKEKNVNLHLIGLIGDGGVHSHSNHLIRICELASKNNVNNVFIHALTDGRDTDPRSGLEFVKEVQEKTANTTAKIASLIGRYYTMDRDKRWERVKVGYDLLVKGIGKKTTNILTAIEESYKEGITDEFIKPIVMVNEIHEPIGIVKPGDVFLCFNFRTDRLREITIALTQKDMPENGMQTIPLEYFTITRYDESFKNIHILFDTDNVENTIGETISKLGLHQLRIAETEKYPHVTFFFSGGREDIFNNEQRVMIPSPKVATYDLQPEMSAPFVKEAVIAEINKNLHDFICLNFANGDMVGHTGFYDSIIKAVETIDSCIGEVVKAAIANNYELMIIADHGNADYAVNPDGSPNTAHSLNPVPCILISNRFKKIENGILADVAPTILNIMGIMIPKEMTGKILVK
ncbi:MAG: 2,3-bisphosphoglycerate-independent phosphoglycerate mutase [Bacteroidia bacterium]|nr:2,3-bisphosphoglycerate-independent phosphoglycerate mutase [Bacteroidia bacterium]